MKPRSLLILTLLFASPAIIADEFAAGMEAYNSGDYETALSIFEQLAEQGNHWAQYNLGLMYAHGRGVPIDNAQAFQWYLKAAEQGNAEAQAMIGAMYYLGQGVTQDHVQAYKWSSLAAENADDDGVKSRSTSLKREIAQEMAPFDVDEAERLAREWQPR